MYLIECFSHNVAAAMLVSQTNPVEVKLFSYVFKHFLGCNKGSINLLLVVNSLLSSCCSIMIVLILYFRCQALFGKLHVSTKGTIEDNGAGFLQVLIFISVVCWSF